MEDRLQSGNEFSKGLNADTYPEVMPPGHLSKGSRNLTIRTDSDNQMVLQKTPGMVEKKDSEGILAAIPNTLVPLAVKSYEDITYIVSYNTLNDKIQYGSIPSRSSGSTEKKDQYGPFLNYKVGDQYTSFEVDAEVFNYKRNTEVDIEIQRSYDGSVNVLTTAEDSIPRIVNSGFKSTNGTLVEIVRNGASNVYSDATILTTELVPNYSTVPTLEFVGVKTGGKLSCGGYRYFIRYINDEGNETDIIEESRTVSVFHSPSTANAHATNDKMSTGQKVVFKLSNADPSYDKIKVYFTIASGESGVVINAYEIETTVPVESEITSWDYDPDTGEQTPRYNYFYNIEHTGYEEIKEISTSVLKASYAPINSAKTVTASSGHLLLGNIKDSSVDNDLFVKAALRCVPYETFNSGTFAALDTPETSFKNPDYCYSKKGLHPGETYEYGIVFILRTGTTGAFPIVGMDLSGYSPEISWSRFAISDYFETIHEGKDIGFVEGLDNDSVPNNLNTRGVFRTTQGFKNSDLDRLYGTIRVHVSTSRMLSNYKAELIEAGVIGYFIAKRPRIEDCVAHGWVTQSNTIPLQYTIQESTTIDYPAIKLPIGFHNFIGVGHGDDGYWGGAKHGPYGYVPAPGCVFPTVTLRGASSSDSDYKPFYASVPTIAPLAMTAVDPFANIYYDAMEVYVDLSEWFTPITRQYYDTVSYLIDLTGWLPKKGDNFQAATDSEVELYEEELEAFNAANPDVYDPIELFSDIGFNYLPNNNEVMSASDAEKLGSTEAYARNYVTKYPLYTPDMMCGVNVLSTLDNDGSFSIRKSKGAYVTSLDRVTTEVKYGYNEVLTGLKGVFRYNRDGDEQEEEVYTSMQLSFIKSGNTSGVPKDAQGYIPTSLVNVSDYSHQSNDSALNYKVLQDSVITDTLPNTYEDKDEWTFARHLRLGNNNVGDNYNISEAWGGSDNDQLQRHAIAACNVGDYISIDFESADVSNRPNWASTFNPIYIGTYNDIDIKNDIIATNPANTYYNNTKFRVDGDGFPSEDFDLAYHVQIFNNTTGDIKSYDAWKSAYGSFSKVAYTACSERINIFDAATENLRDLDGDCYMGIFDHRVFLNKYKDDVPQARDGINYYSDLTGFQLSPTGVLLSLPCISKYNFAVRMTEKEDSVGEKLFLDDRSFYPKDPTILGNFQSQSNSYLDGISDITSVKSHYAINTSDPILSSIYDNRVMASEADVANTFINSYRSFTGLSYNDYAESLGRINKITTVGDLVFIVHTNGISSISVLQKEMIQTEGNSENIFIDSAKVLPTKETIISTNIGGQFMDSIIKVGSYLYGVDILTNKIWRVSKGGFQVVSDGLVQSLLFENTKGTQFDDTNPEGIVNIIASYDVTVSSVTFTFHKRDGKLFTLQLFESAEGVVWAPVTDNHTLFTGTSSGDKFHLRLRDDDPDNLDTVRLFEETKEFYNADKYINSDLRHKKAIIEFIVNDKVSVDKVFELLKFYGIGTPTSVHIEANNTYNVSINRDPIEHLIRSTIGNVKPIGTVTDLDATRRFITVDFKSVGGANLVLPGTKVTLVSASGARYKHTVVYVDSDTITVDPAVDPAYTIGGYLLLGWGGSVNHTLMSIRDNAVFIQIPSALMSYRFNGGRDLDYVKEIKEVGGAALPHGRWFTVRLEYDGIDPMTVSSVISEFGTQNYEF